MRKPRFVIVLHPVLKVKWLLYIAETRFRRRRYYVHLDVPLFRRSLRRQGENVPLSAKNVFPLRARRRARGLAIGIRSVYFRLGSGNSVKHLYPPCRRLIRFGLCCLIPLFDSSAIKGLTAISLRDARNNTFFHTWLICSVYQTLNIYY